MKSRTVNFYDIFGGIFLTAGAAIVLRCALFVVSGDIWFDELFTVELASKPLKELVRLASSDVHPPLYYILVRSVYLALNSVFRVNIAAVAKLTSIIPYFLLFFYDLYYVRKRFGLLGCGLAFFCCAAMPQLTGFIVEARMYSWSAFVILAMYIHAMCVAGNNPYSIHLPAVLIYGIMALYLHYYSAVAAVCIVIFLFIRIIVNRKNDRDGLHKTLFSLTICLLAGIGAYIPWLKSLAGQAGAVKKNYWILPLTWRTIPGCVKYVFKPEFDSSILNVVFAVVLFMGCAACFVIFLIRPYGLPGDDTAAPRAKLPLVGLFIIPICTAAVGMIASVIIRPVFIYRYMVPVLFLFWTGIACLLSELLYNCPDIRLKAVSVLFCGLLLVCGMRSFEMFRAEESKKAAGFERAEDILKALDEIYPEEVCVCNFNQLQALMWFYTDREVWLWGETGETLIGEICGEAPITMISDCPSLKDKIRGSGADSFLFFGSFNAREDIIKEWESQGFEINLLYDSCLIERYYYNIYRVTLN